VNEIAGYEAEISNANADIAKYSEELSDKAQSIQKLERKKMLENWNSKGKRVVAE
jgi:hypothetical protein